MQPEKQVIKSTLKKIYHFYPFTTSNLYNRIIFALHGIKCGKRLNSRGRVIVVRKATDGYKKGEVTIGNDVVLRSSLKSNPVSQACKCVLYSFNGGRIHIGNNVGISNSVLVSYESIRIEDNVRIGAGCTIYDTDSHSINFDERMKDVAIPSRPVLIKNGAWLGEGVTVLKGVTIGEYSVVGAKSVVTKDVPNNEIWAGNPAKFIRKLEC